MFAGLKIMQTMFLSNSNLYELLNPLKSRQMYNLKDIVRINDRQHTYHSKKCIVVKKSEAKCSKGYTLSYDVETTDTQTRIRVVGDQLIGVAKG